MSAFMYFLRALDLDTREILGCWAYASWDEAAHHMEEFVARFGWMPNVNIRIVQK